MKSYNNYFTYNYFTEKMILLFFEESKILYRSENNFVGIIKIILLEF